MSAYSEKFKNPKWQKKRLKIMERDGFKCQGDCANPDVILHVHHKYYIKNKEPWEYEDCALITLCEDCHLMEQNEKKRFEDLLIHTLYDIGFMADDLREIAFGFHKFKLTENHDWVSVALSMWLSDKKNQEGLIQWAFPHRKIKKEKQNGKTKSIENG